MTKNKIISLILSIILFWAPSIGETASADYAGHWAEAIISQMIREGYVKGDAQGRILADQPITRGEFITVLNRVMGFSALADNSFADIPVGAWYESEFKKAKHQGYLTGDHEGRAFPEALISRVEAAMILYRVLKHSEVKEALPFSDRNELPSWSIEAIGALVKSEYLSGYPDNTFRPHASMTRAESFTLILKGKKADKESQNEKPVETTEQKLPLIGASITSGGGRTTRGSSSERNQIKPLYPPVVIGVSNDYIYRWKSVSGSSGYRIRANYQGKEIFFTTNNTQIDLFEALETFSKDCYESSLIFEVSVMTVAESGYKDSDYSGITQVKKVLYDPENQADLGLTILFNEENGQETYEVSWRGEAIKLEIRRKDPALLKQILSVSGPYDITEYLIQDGEFVATPHVITVYAEDGSQSVMVNPDFAGGDGTPQNPYQIASLRHFQNAYKTPGLSYLQVRDLTFGEDYENPYQQKGLKFSGTYQGQEGGSHLSLVVRNGKSYTSLFGYLENALIKNITVTGMVEAEGSYIGAIAGFAVNTTLSECENQADITVNFLDKVSEQGFVGGLVGAIEGTGEIVSSRNSGRIESSTGITGGITGQNKNVIIRQCVNIGSVIVDNEKEIDAESPVGGISGKSLGEIIGCENHGTVENNFSSENPAGLVIMVGGIVGLTLSAVIDCVNGENAMINAPIQSGTPSSALAGQIGGIAGQLHKDGSKISGCKNYGKIETATVTNYWAGGISGLTYKKVETCANFSDRIVTSQPGGIVGRNAGQIISYCYNVGSFSGTGYTGGLVGRADANSVIEHSFNLGSFTGKYQGGVIGNTQGSTTVNYCYSYSYQLGSTYAITSNGGSNISGNHIYYIPFAQEVNNTIARSVTVSELIKMGTIFTEDLGWIIKPIDEENFYPLPQIIKNPCNLTITLL